MDILGYLVLAFFAWLGWSSLRAQWSRPPLRTPPPLPAANQGRSQQLRAPALTEAAVAKASQRGIDLSALPATIRKQIEELPAKSMDHLQQQWLKAVRAIDRLPADRAAGHLALRAAILAEWSARAHSAAKDPQRFAWPSTAATGGNGSLQTENWHEIGMLSYLGYRVGATQGEPNGVRRQILDMCFASDLPPINGLPYWQQWGAPGSSLRLRKLAYEIASFARNAKRKRSANLAVAVAQWEADLSYLYQQYYVRRFRFAWPETEIVGSAPRSRRRRRR